MQDLENFGEELSDVETSIEENVDCSPSDEAEDCESSGDVERDEPIGKFKNVDDLLSAYNNLQAEFTRKSQKLAELEKDKTQQPNQMEVALSVFLSKNQEAVVYADELKRRVENDKSLSNDKDAFEKAWAGLLYEKLTSKERTKEPAVLNLIKGNDIQDMIIRNYYKQLQELKTPVVMSSGSGERVTKTTQKTPNSFDEAKRVAVELLKD